jgi:polysaccharide biosynthesis/export protein VpsN
MSVSFLAFPQGIYLMCRLLNLLLLILFSIIVNAGGDSYRLGAGDLIKITVYDEPDLSLDILVGLSGSISYPLLGDIQVVGLSPRELEENLVKRLKGSYLVDPSVTVVIEEYRPFYVSGEVVKPGSYAFHPGLTIEKAVSIAGGFTERASKSKIKVLRDEDLSGSGNAKTVTGVKLSDVVSPGDVITVEQSFF